jgi:hypothetical protein
MKQWTTRDFLQVVRRKNWDLNRSFQGIHDFSAEVVAAIYRHSILSALTTNARTVQFLVDAVEQKLMTLNTAREHWQNFLWENTAELVASVVDRYIGQSGLRKLLPKEKRRVAAWVLSIIELSRSHGRPPKTQVPLSRGTLNPPFWIAVQHQPVLWGLMDVNIEYSEQLGRQTCNFDRESENSVLLSPALAIVLFSLLGGTASVVTSWAGQEHVTALFAFRQIVLQAVERCIQSDAEDRVLGLDQELSELQIVQTKTVPAAGAKIYFSLPLFKTNVVWINGPAAPYADVVARFVLYQSKHTETDATVIFLLKELVKCGLLKSEFVKGFDSKVWERAQRGLIVTNALYATWTSASSESTPNDQSTLKRDHESSLKTPPPSKSRLTSESKLPSNMDMLHKQDSRAYPEAMLHMPSTDENPIAYIDVTSESDSAKDRSWDPKITFVVSFNLRDTVLKLDMTSTTKRDEVGRALQYTNRVPEWVDVRLPADIALSSSNVDENGFFQPANEAAQASWNYINFLWAG